MKHKNSILLLSSALSCFLLVGCSGIVPVDNKLKSAIVQSTNNTMYNTLAFVVDNHYGASVTGLKTNSDSSFEFLLKDRIRVSSSAYKDNLWNSEITSPNDPSLYQDMGKVTLWLMGSSDQAILCQQNLIQSLPHISSLRTTFHNADKTETVPVSGCFWLENDTIHIVYSARFLTSSL